MSAREYPGLNWTMTGSPGEYQECVLGTQQDGVYFTLMHMPSCYRRGPYRLLVTVFGGPNHHKWGCFDADDQPMRWYHLKVNALEEAEALARVLWADRYRLETLAQAIDELNEEVPHEGTAI